MSTKVLISLDFQGVARLLSLPDAVSDQEPATFAQLKAAIEGLNWKDNVRVATQANLDLSTPGATIDGVTMSAGDRVLVKANSTAAQNGVYIWNGASTAMTRSADASTAGELKNAIVTVDEGTSAGSTWRQTAVSVTLGTDPVAWTAFGVVAPPASDTTAGIAELATQAEVNTGTDAVRIVTPQALAGWTGRLRRHAADLGDGSATSFTITHNFNTLDVIAQVRRNSGNRDVVLCDMEVLDANSVRFTFAAAPTSGQFRAIILA